MWFPAPIVLLISLPISWALITNVRPSPAPRVHVATRRALLLATAAAAPVLSPLAARAGIDVSRVRVEGSPRPAESGGGGNIELAGVSYTPAAMILQMAEQTASMEGIMRQSAKDMESQNRLQRFAAGSEGRGPGVVGRDDLTKSVNVMIQNSKIASIAPSAAVTLTGIPRAVAGGRGDMAAEEYTMVGGIYAAAREDLRRAFEAMSPEDQAGGKAIVRRLRAKDEEQMQEAGRR